MRVMIVGGGFIGGHLAGRLRAEGCAVTVAGRRGADMACDLARDDTAVWAQRLRGYDALVNCAGILAAGANYDGVHARGAIALFDGAAQAGVARVVQISSLGASDGTTAYHRSKRAADEHLVSLNLGWAIVRPSLVVGRGGGSAALFSALAALPLMPDMGGGMVQPIAIDDLVEAIWRLLRRPLPMSVVVDAVGPEPMRLVDLMAILRRWLGFEATRSLPVPRWMMRWVATLGIGPMTRDSLTMLEAGNAAPVEPFVAALGFVPQPVARALDRSPATQGDRLAARLSPLGPVLRGLLAAVWLAGGLVPLLLTPMASNTHLLARLGLTGEAAIGTVWAGSLADMAVGLALILRWHGAALAGVALMGAYSLILAAVAPELWADPFGALVKNLAVLGLSLAIHAMEKPHA
ncbi:NAD-dependent epimerase/dehydratase [Novosphingobium nitrogenifigens DSM 19370]|uniref:NAD-dependent epimerase/dehydratase n=1 Tax=Novosphingobium nitrogenifigens DSM 19370 TaxID=983920 RepID=F1Z469_9SPHN|nr:SDR family oxidoreductase [Novosphingobium nitrogenifigens]EGD60479.1 NAD-dependent epimerase/dehydratase [Novosphingobium nitrogenifigens DSM 19370]